MLTLAAAPATTAGEQLQQFLNGRDEGRGAQIVEQSLRHEPQRALDVILEEELRSDARLYALAMASSPRFAPTDINRRALAAMPGRLARGEQLIRFAAFVSTMRGWGRALRTSIGQWYLVRPVGEVAAQVLPDREAHRNLLRMAHPKPDSLARNALFQWIANGELGHLATPELRGTELALLHAADRARSATQADEVIALIEDYGLPMAAIPAAWRDSARVWHALLDRMSHAELVACVGELVSQGVLTEGAPETALVIARLVDRARIRQARVPRAQYEQALRESAGNPALRAALHEALRQVAEAAA
jgi:60 kDa SS-A/Ro ribonucleoprotein